MFNSLGECYNLIVDELILFWWILCTSCCYAKVISAAPPCVWAATPINHIPVDVNVQEVYGCRGCV